MVMKIIEPISGHLACGDEAMGKLANVAALKEAVIDAAEQSDELRGKRVLITCGATQESRRSFATLPTIQAEKWRTPLPCRQNGWEPMLP